MSVYSGEVRTYLHLTYLFQFISEKREGKMEVRRNASKERGMDKESKAKNN